MARHFEIIQRASLEFQGTVYEPKTHNLICEVYLASEAEHITQALNAHEALLSATRQALAYLALPCEQRAGSEKATLAALTRALAQAEGWRE